MYSLMFLGAAAALPDIAAALTTTLTSTIIVTGCGVPTSDVSTSTIFPTMASIPSMASNTTVPDASTSISTTVSSSVAIDSTSASILPSSTSSAAYSGPSGMIYDVFQIGPNAPKHHVPATQYPPDDKQITQPNKWDNDAADYLFSGSGESINWSCYDYSNYSNDASGPSFVPLPGKNFVFNSGNTVFLYHGYFKAPVDGTYGLNVNPKTDNIGWIWTGDKAYSGNWNANNYDAYAELWYVEGPHNDFSFPAKADTLIPVTIALVNQGEWGVLQIDVVDAQGTLHNDITGFFVPPAADPSGSKFNSPPSGVTATQGPPGPDWLLPAGKTTWAA